MCACVCACVCVRGEERKTDTQRGTQTHRKRVWFGGQRTWDKEGIAWGKDNLNGVAKSSSKARKSRQVRVFNINHSRSRALHVQVVNLRLEQRGRGTERYDSWLEG